MSRLSLSQFQLRHEWLYWHILSDFEPILKTPSSSSCTSKTEDDQQDSSQQLDTMQVQISTLYARVKVTAGFQSLAHSTCNWSGEYLAGCALLLNLCTMQWNCHTRAMDTVPVKIASQQATSCDHIAVACSTTHRSCIAILLPHKQHVVLFHIPELCSCCASQQTTLHCLLAQLQTTSCLPH